MKPQHITTLKNVFKTSTGSMHHWNVAF